MAGKADNLSAKQRRALDALLSGATPAQAAAAAGVSGRTLARWRNESAFDGALRAASRQALDDATVQLASRVHEVLATLDELRADGDAPAGVRLRAAQAQLDAFLRLHELTDIQARLDALESQAGI